MHETNRLQTMPARRGGPAAFTIIEMLVVVGIIGVLVAILLPAIGGVRRSAGNSKTLTTITDLMQASQQFLTDNRRLPGYFTVEEMGNAANESRGFPMMANILLDLSGGVLEPGDSAAGLATITNVGPIGANTITVLPERIGSDKGGVGAAKSLYYVPDPTALKEQTDQGAMTGLEHHRRLPHLVDAFGTPLLAWGESETISTTAEFASASASQPARFYWTTNSAFLARGATAVGRQRTDQQNDSLLGGRLSDTDLVDTMTALLGHPSYPDSQDPPQPASARGQLVIHSAGPNGVYLGKNEQVAKMHGGGPILYTGKDDPIRRSDDLIRALGQ